MLVQRSLLDFLIYAFPMHNEQMTKPDMAKVVKAAVNVLLRRDMSLNRRLYAWLLGTSTKLPLTQGHSLEPKLKGEHSEENENMPELLYFEKYSQKMLVQALKAKLAEKHEGSGCVNVKAAVLKPFRILISLLDKPEIGPVILESVLLAIFRCLHREFEHSKSSVTPQSNKQEKAEANTYDELLKTANLLFGTFEPYFIWDYVARIFEQACTAVTSRGTGKSSSVLTRQISLHENLDSVTVAELCELVSFLLDIVSLVRNRPDITCLVLELLTIFWYEDLFIYF